MPSSTQLRQVPASASSEAVVLAAMLHNGDVLEEVLACLTPDDFYMPRNRALFELMRDMYDRSYPIDDVSLKDYAARTDALAKIGGEKAVDELQRAIMPLVTWEGARDEILRLARLRALIAACTKINTMAYSAPVETSEIVERVESTILDATESTSRCDYKHLMEFVSEACREAREMDGYNIGALTNFPTLDGMLGGLRPGQLVILGARPAVGKTSFALNIALSIAASGFTVGFFSLEMSGKELAQRLMCAHAQVSLTALRAGTLSEDEWSSLARATQELSTLDIIIDDVPGTTMSEIRAKARRMLHNKGRAVIIIDYLQLINPPANGRAENRAVEVSEMSRALKIMAKDLDIPIIVLSQLSRAVESRTDRRPQLSDLRESGSIEQDADIVMFLDRSADEKEATREDRPDEGITRLIVAKNRSGKTGDVDLFFAPASTKFTEITG